jgi:hypothetical protein
MTNITFSNLTTPVVWTAIGRETKSAPLQKHIGEHPSVTKNQFIKSLSNKLQLVSMVDFL